MYPDSDSRSALLHKRGKRSIPGGISRGAVHFPPYPLYAVKGNGCRITDVDGVERIDFVNNMTAIIAGHSHPHVVAAVSRQAAQLMGVGMPTEVEIELAELICRRVAGIERIRFANSGTEAVLYAIRAARAYTGRQKIARGEGAYHGGIDSMETSQSASRPGTWGPADHPNTTLNNRGVPRSVRDDVITLPLNNLEASKAILDENIHDLAAVVIDPFIGRLGWVALSAEYLEMVREFTRSTGTVLIFDEVMSFRVSHAGAQGLVGITPDLTALGKIIGGGLPIGAVGGLAEFMGVFEPDGTERSVVHSGTYNGNPMSMAAGLAALEVMTPEAYDHIAGLGDRLRAGLKDVLSNLGIPGYVQGIASLSFMRLGDDRPIHDFRDLAEQQFDKELSMRLHHYLLNHGVHAVEACKWILSLPMTAADIDFAVDQVADGLRAVT